MFGFRERRILSVQDVREKPTLDRLLVPFQDVLAEAKAGMEKSLIVLCTA
jgi:hypothetical protein